MARPNRYIGKIEVPVVPMVQAVELHDMKKSMDEVGKELAPSTSLSPEFVNEYPYGLCLRLTEKELDKLGLDDNASVGDGISLYAIAKVTSVSEQETAAGTRCNVELQITHLGLGPEHDMGDGEGE